MTLATCRRLPVVEAVATEYGLHLNSGQLRAVAELKDWCLAPGSGERAVLSGVAGTGKTTVLQLLVTELVANDPCRDWIWVTAPTHKAAKVLSQKLEAYSDYPLPVPVTIHHALGLKPKKVLPHEPEGFNKTGEPRVRRGDLIIVDECSMIGAELHRLILEAAKHLECRVLFTGDPKQLQPVNERRTSLSFSAEAKWELTEVMRHAGAVLDLATKVRSMHRNGLPCVRTQVGHQSSVYAYPEMEDLVGAWERELQNSEFPVFLCWTNKIRREFNKRARRVIHGEDVPDFMPGDELVMLKAYELGGQVVLSNNQEVKVVEAEYTCATPVEELETSYECWKLRLAGFGSVHVLADCESKRFKKDLSELAKELRASNDQANAAYDFALESVMDSLKVPEKEARKHPLVVKAQKKVAQQRSRWRDEYFALKEFFVDVDFNYAVTIHKSQGSTYDKVFIHNDYLRAQGEKLQLLYVAVTRAAKQVHHIEL